MNNLTYSRRKGILTDTDVIVSLDNFRRLFRTLIYQFISDGYFSDSFGYDDKYEKRWIRGRLTENWDNNHINDVIFHRIGKDNLWPIEEKSSYYTEADIFDLIEFFFSIASKPEDRAKGPFIPLMLNPLYSPPREIIFDEDKGKDDFIRSVNGVLTRYEGKYILSDNGLIELNRNDTEIQLCNDIIFNSENDPDINKLIKRAIDKFIQSRGNELEMHDSIRILSDVLESLKPIIIENIKADEKELFHIINKFGIRHKRYSQLIDYQKDIYYNWIFYSLLATINLKVHYSNVYNFEKG